MWCIRTQHSRVGATQTPTPQVQTVLGLCSFALNEAEATMEEGRHTGSSNLASGEHGIMESLASETALGLCLPLLLAAMALPPCSQGEVNASAPPVAWPSALIADAVAVVCRAVRLVGRCSATQKLFQAFGSDRSFAIAQEVARRSH